jgi:hypothetical protein
MRPDIAILLAMNGNFKIVAQSDEMVAKVLSH